MENYKINVRNLDNGHITVSFEWYDPEERKWRDVMHGYSTPRAAQQDIVEFVTETGNWEE